MPTSYLVTGDREAMTNVQAYCTVLTLPLHITSVDRNNVAFNVKWEFF